MIWWIMGKYAIISWNISCFNAQRILYKESGSYGGRNVLPYLKESNFVNIFIFKSFSACESFALILQVICHCDMLTSCIYYSS